MPAETSTPVIAHLGVGAFHRAHQAWYTHLAARTGEEWSITAFTGRTPEQARLLQDRGGAYTLLIRGAEGDEVDVVHSIRAVHDGADRDAWESALADEATRILTLTITEAGYLRTPQGALDTSASAVAHDLRTVLDRSDRPLTTAPVRIALGLAARRASGAGALAVIACDNLAANGEAARAVVFDAAMAIDHTLADWIDENVSFVSSMVDRITPRTTDADIDEVERRTGIRDRGTVVTEPFSEWIVEDAVAGPRPSWDAVGVRVTSDLAPFEQRKLRLLNGAHSLLAYRGLLRGFDDVAGAFSDTALRDLVEEYWESAAASCTLPRAELDEAIAATRLRFANPRIRHRLSQIALDGAHKLPQRIVPVLEHAQRSGRPADAAASAIAAWAVLGGHTAGEIDALLAGSGEALTEMRESIARELRRLEDTTIGAVPRQ
ncbi:mannitol dehydrogenase family protein [Streptomyces sp. AC495_CC817]|uniref:mannitol dehydrogenase family protein n=1 Tax=Streptomyces sp. AC495_CC817 TaxID=2823900 RepID=UPI001C256616|nr:mannitol dehydrogenase family protein [Streptomyces sp. AC495_CC817]